MKKRNIAYWICTVLFAGFMIFSAVPDILLSAETRQFMSALGYPDYFTQFIGYAKLLGSIAVLLPLPRRLKEWAYAGLFFDLAGAVYSCVAVFGFDPGLLFMVLPIGLGIASYLLFRTRPTQQEK